MIAAVAAVSGIARNMPEDAGVGKTEDEGERDRERMQPRGPAHDDGLEQVALDLLDREDRPVGIGTPNGSSSAGGEPQSGRRSDCWARPVPEPDHLLRVIRRRPLSQDDQDSR